MIFRKFLFLILIQIIVLEINAQDNRVSADEEMRGIFKDTWSPSFFGDLETNNVGTGGDPSQDVTDAPIDGGLGFLLAAGAGYVAHGLNRKRKRRKNDEDEEVEATDR